MEEWANACEYCGTFEDVEYQIDPFAEEIYGEENWMYICEDCHYNRKMDI